MSQWKNNGQDEITLKKGGGGVEIVMKERMTAAHMMQQVHRAK